MTMKSGTYYLGDLCYVLNDSTWSEVCSLVLNGNSVVDGEFNLPDGRRFAMYSTAYGDGTYEDQEGSEYCVDSGSIGCILLDDVDRDDWVEQITGGATVHFPEPFTTGAQDGVIQIGEYLIDTAPQDDEAEWT